MSLGIRLPHYTRRERLALIYAWLVLLSLYITVSPVEAASITVTGDFVAAPIGTNIMSTGFHITHEWEDLHDSATITNWFEDTGFKIIRIQEFRDTNDPCITWNEATHSGTWDWTHVDEILDWADANDAYVLVCFLSFTSSGAGSLPGHASSTHMHNSGTTGMPSPTEYAYYVEDWAQHIVAVGHTGTVRFWEIGNEAWQYYGTSSPDTTKLHNYINLYNAAQAELEAHCPTSYVGNDGMTYKSTISEFDLHGANVTLLDFHKYDTGSTTSTDGYIFRRAEQYMVTTGSYYYSPDDVKQYWATYGVGGAQAIVINSECQLNYAWSPTDDRIQYITGAVWNSLVLRVEALTMNVTAHVYFDEYATSSPSGFGYIDYSTPKLYYGYYPYLWLGTYLGVGDSFRTVTSTSVNCRTMAWNDTALNAYIYLIHNSTSLDTVTVTAAAWNVSRLVNVYKIDNTYPWDNALVQTTTANASSMSVSFNGYGVAILEGKLPGAAAPSPGPGNYNYYGGLSEVDNTHTGPIITTIYDDSGNFENLTVDAALTDPPTGINMSNLHSFIWPIGSGAYRRYTPTSLESTFYLYIPNAAFTIYNFHILDYAGTFWTGTSYLKTIKVLAGVERTLEQIETTGNPINYDISVSLVAGRNYIIELVDSLGTRYRYEFYAGSVTTINLYVNPTEFSQQVKAAYKYVRGEATRSANMQVISMNYQDDMAETAYLNITIYYKNWTIAYSTSANGSAIGGDLISYVWSSADNDTDYRVRMVSTHDYFGSMYWDYPLPAVASYLVPFDISFFGTQSWLPYAIPFSLVAVVGGVFSTLSAPVGVFAMVGVAALLKYLGWMNVEWNNIGLAMFVVFLYAITRKKREENI